MKLHDFPHRISVPRHTTPGKGELLVLDASVEGLPDFPRTYWITVPRGFFPSRVARGGHAHWKCGQLFFVLKGQAVFRYDDGRRWGEVHLSGGRLAGEGLYMPPLWWHSMEIAKGSVILALASVAYDERDYIRERVIFEEEMRKRRMWGEIQKGIEKV